MTRLDKCPASPNCVCSCYPDDTEHFIEPLTFKKNVKSSLKKICLEKFKRCELVQEKENYLHFVFTSFLFRFKDDLEFVIDSKKKVVHVRSASRVGHSDLGVNKKRVEKIREYLG